MFENIIGQTEVIKTIKEALSDNSLPHSMLFYGPEMSGKLSTALELARILCCTQTAAWNCHCNSCDKHRLLMHPNLLIMGFRNFLPEIISASDVLMRCKKLSAKYLFIRAVHKQLKAYDPVLWEGDETKIKSVQTQLYTIEELLQEFSPDLQLPADKELKKKTDEIIKLCTKIASANKTDNIPINMVRKTVFWAHHSLGSLNKIVVIDNADKMHDSSRNSLLKILEEPPANAYFILLTQRKGAIIQTLLSRLRAYSFKERTEEESADVLRKVFQEESGEYKSVRDYFLAWQDLNPTNLKNAAHKFLNLVLDKDQDVEIFQELKELVSTDNLKDALSLFFEELLSLFRNILLSRETKENHSALDCHLLSNWTEIIRQSLFDAEQLNINPKNILENIYFRFKESL